MSSILKKLRGSLSLGALWGTAAAGLSSVFDLFRIGSVGWDRLLENALTLGGAGFVGGVLFSLLLVFAEGRRDGGKLSLLRGMTWGLLGGLVMPFIMMAVLNPGTDLMLGLWIMLENWPSSLLPWALFGGLFGAATVAAAGSDPDVGGPDRAVDMLGAPRPDSPLERDLARNASPQPREVL